MTLAEYLDIDDMPLHIEYGEFIYDQTKYIGAIHNTITRETLYNVKNFEHQKPLARQLKRVINIPIITEEQVAQLDKFMGFTCDTVTIEYNGDIVYEEKASATGYYINTDGNGGASCFLRFGIQTRRWDRNNKKHTWYEPITGEHYNIISQDGQLVESSGLITVPYKL